MKIEIRSTFLDGRDRYEAGDTRTVSDEDGVRFIAAGWAAEVGGAAVAQAEGHSNLDIHNAVIGTGDSNG